MKVTIETTTDRYQDAKYGWGKTAITADSDELSANQVAQMCRSALIAQGYPESFVEEAIPKAEWMS